MLRNAVVNTFGDKPKLHTIKELVSEMRHQGLTTEDSVASIRGNTQAVSNQGLQVFQRGLPGTSRDVAAIQRANINWQLRSINRQFRSEQKQLSPTVDPPPAEVSAFEVIATADMYN